MGEGDGDLAVVGEVVVGAAVVMGGGGGLAADNTGCQEDSDC